MGDKERLEKVGQYLENTFTDGSYNIALCETIGIPKEDLGWLIYQVKNKEEELKQWRSGELETVENYDAYRSRGKQLMIAYSQIEKYRDVLGFYANEINYKNFIENGKSNINRDSGNKARQVLGK